MAYWYIRQPGYKYFKNPDFEDIDVMLLPYMPTDEIQSLSGKENQMSLSKVKEMRYKFFESLGFEIPELVIDSTAPAIPIVDVYIYKCAQQELVCGPEFKILASTSNHKKFVLCSVLSEIPKLYSLGSKLYTVKEDKEEVAAFPGVKINVAHTIYSEEPAIFIQKEDREQVLGELNRRARQFFNLPEDEVSYMTTGSHMTAENKSKEELLIEGNFKKFEVVECVDSELLKKFLETHRNLKCITFHHGIRIHRGPYEYPPALNTVENIVVLNTWASAWFYVDNFKGKNLVLLDAEFHAGPLNRFLKAWKAGQLPNLESFFFTFKPHTQAFFLPTMFDGVLLKRHEYTADERPYEFNSGISSVYSHPFNFNPGGRDSPFFDIHQKNNVRQASVRFGLNKFLMIVWPNIVVAENLEPEVVEEEMGDEDVLESDDCENLGADDDLSVATKSPTPSPLGSPARSQEVNEVPMPIGSPIRPGTPVPTGFPEGRFQITKVSLPMVSSVPTGCNKPKGTTVKVGLRIPASTLFPAKFPGYGPTVPKRPLFAIESLRSMKAASSANTQNGQPQLAGFSSSNGSSVPDKFAKPVGTPVKAGLLIPAGSPRCGPIVPKRPRIESPSSSETTSPAMSQNGQSQPAELSSPNRSSVPDGFAKLKGTPLKVSIPIPSGSPECGPTVPKKPEIAIESPTSIETSSPAKSREGQLQQTGVVPPNESSIPDGFVKPKETPLQVGLPISSGSPESGCIERVGTAVKVGLPIPARSPECKSPTVEFPSSIRFPVPGGPTVTEKPEIAVESPSSTVLSSSANAQIGQSQPAGGPSPMASSIPDGFAKPNETPVNVGLPFPKGSPDRGPTVPKRARIAIESPTSIETSSPAKSREGLSQSAGFSSPHESTVSAGSSKTNGTPHPVVSAFLNNTSFPPGYAEPTKNLMAAVSETTKQIAFVKWQEAQARIAQVSLLMESPGSDGIEFGASIAEIRYQLARTLLLLRCSPLEPPIPAVGISNPAGSHQGQSQLATVASPNQSSVAVRSTENNADPIAFRPPISVSDLSFSAGSQKDLSQLATADTSMESSVPSGQKQVAAVGSLNDDGKQFPGSSPNPNELSPFPGPERIMEKIKETATPEQVNGIVNAVESPITVESSSPTASFDRNGLPMAVRSPIRTETSSPAESFEEEEPSPLATANGLAIVVESPNATGNGNPAASSDQNGLPAAVELPHRTETSLPAGSLEDGSEKSNGNPVALGPFIPATKKSFSAGSRKRPAHQITSESVEPHKLPLTVKTAIPAGLSLAKNLAKAGSTEPNKLPTTTGSKFPSFQAFSNAFVGHLKTIHSCLTRISSMVAFLPNGEPVQLGSLLPDGSLSTVDSQPSPGSVAGPPPKASSAPLPEPQAEENGSESKDVEITTFRIVSVYSHPVNLKPGGGAHPFFFIFRRDNVRQGSPRFGANTVLMMPNIVVDENLKPEDVEEEMEDEDALESDDDENLGANLSVTTKSPTPSPLGSPARRSSSCRFQEVTEVPMPTGSPIQPKTPVPAGLPETRFQITDVSLPMSSFVPTECIESKGTAVKFGSPIPDGTLFSAESSECGPIVPKRPRIAIESPSAIGQSEAAASSNGPPVPARHIEPKLTPVKVGLLIPAGSPKCGPIVPKPPIPVSGISCPAGSQEGLSKLATNNASIESSVPVGQEQDGFFTAVGSSNDDGKPFPASSPNPNELSPFPGLAKYPFLTDFDRIKEEIEETNRRMGRTVAEFESTLSDTPEHVNGIVNAVESPITVESSSPTASSDQNGFSMAVRSLTRTEALLPTESIKEATVDSPIQSVPNGSKQGNESSVPVGSLEVGSNKSNGGPAAIGPLISATKMYLPAGSRKRLDHGKEAGSTEPNKCPSASGSAFSSVRAFSNAFFGHLKKVQSCLVQFSSMVVFLPNDNSATSSLASSLPAEAVSAPSPKPQPPENGPESMDIETEEDDY
ncbi:hypothetical protein L5515_016442 [Caenorhabditis briggsae]|uniref:Uncharacterized protein n=1 Tax=Caenorhabditis briggsae TaxID=6238 RepID=A0AAE9FDC2_CAEBR|nr:hypothetical protein L5515_016442 [Caenorhabditis briggsae]